MTVLLTTSCVLLPHKMQISREFLEAEISALAAEIDKAKVFLIKAQGTIEAYKMLISKLEEPEQEE